MRFDGVIKSWNDERGFGFIAPTRGGDEIFLHVKAFKPGNGRPQLNQHVSFEVELGPQGKKRAVNVEPFRVERGRARRPEMPAPWTLGRTLAIPAFAAVYIVATVLWRVPAWVSIVYVVASGITFVAYWLDKSASVTGAWRISEDTLHALALACGWPGALLAQQLLRHKTSKPAFRVKFWTLTGVNVVLFVLATSPLGRSVIVKVGLNVISVSPRP